MAGLGRRGAGDLARTVLDVLVAAGEPLTVTQVQERLPNSLAYTTVLTTLNRLTEKGALVRGPGPGRAHVFAPAAPQEQIPAAMTARRMVDLLGSEADRAEALAHFVADLGPADGQLLAGLLAAHSRTQARGGSASA